MKTDTLIFYSSVKASLKRKTLFKGTFLSVLGMIPVFYSSLYIGPAELSYIGLPLFILGLVLIAIGMIPYRKLTYLENHPHKLELVDGAGIIYSQHGKKTFTIPLSAIEKIDYLDDNSSYGILIYLKQNPQDKIMVHLHSFDISRYQKFSKRWFNSDLYFPYFSRRSCDDLRNAMNEVV